MTLSGWCGAGAHVNKTLEWQNPCPQGPENGGNCTCECHTGLEEAPSSRFAPKKGRKRRVESTPPL